MQIAIGGGTPTYLNADELKSVLTMISRDWPVDRGGIPYSVEVSPGTVDAEKLSVMADYGVRRISMGVQSFVARDLHSLGRPQSSVQVETAIEKIRNSAVDIFNLDLIYGSQGQTEADWIRTVQHALSHRPEELVNGEFADLTPQRLFLNANGLAHSDVIGPWLYSESVRRRMERFELR